MADDNVIRLPNIYLDPIITARSGKITLSFNIEGCDTIEIEGTITMSEAAFLHLKLGKYIMEHMESDK